MLGKLVAQLYGGSKARWMLIKKLPSWWHFNRICLPNRLSSSNRIDKSVFLIDAQRQSIRDCYEEYGQLHKITFKAERQREAIELYAIEEIDRIDRSQLRNILVDLLDKETGLTGRERVRKKLALPDWWTDHFAGITRPGELNVNSVADGNESIVQAMQAAIMDCYAKCNKSELITFLVRSRDTEIPSPQELLEQKHRDSLLPKLISTMRSKLAEPGERTEFGPTLRAISVLIFSVT